MTQLFNGRLPSLVIPNGAANSQSFDWGTAAFDTEALTVIAPAALDALTYTWEVSTDGGTTFRTLQDLTATDMKVPAAGKAMIYNGVFSGITHLRIHASGNAAADRTFTMMKATRA